ncbi:MULTISPECIES: mechanosensitive ion channel family protein [unclassified Marivivens]|uniref:mechanosensitive ion channel family protein n=1 Tax=unclassified Marivivens TaxID=2622455 RepID=UPI0007FC00CD|nr:MULTISPECIES: mechanosensitive ion channel domain-containing protein [unclassified Marivivens]MCL7407053.1 mechanosensitive ion channel [Marivivens geojensis]OBR38541.1 mechanosensitive ion channel protein MscS [Donghicola sp. JL3646]APO87807.1 mechanosensitive ion channel protein MscS [Marivivens sp. JLT3646]NBQ49629.1 mechanosensitive ion channel family protein [Marivivens sp.]NBT50690.1 mechanosensitive ion channel family protein [Marivivens sp.]
MQDLLQTEIYNGKTIADYLTLEFVAGLAGDILSVVLIIVLGFVLSGWVRRRIVAIGGRNKHLDVTLFNFLGNIVRYLILAFASLFVLNTFGIQTTSLVALIGAAGLAIGLALQGTLSNVAAGVMIILFRPIKIGDFVQVSGVSGTVKDISLNYTELADAGNVQVIVPNAQVWGNTITNFSVNQTRRAEWIFGVGYGADLKLAEQVIRDTILSDPRSLADPAPFLQVNNLGDFSVDFLCRVWVKSSDYFQYQADMKRQVKEALDKAGIDIPFPTRTVLNNQA